jgi:hypothetical protein
MPETASAVPALPDGLVAVVKRACPTCETVAPVLRELAARTALTVYTQDDLAFPEGLAPRTTPARRLLPPPDRDGADALARRERRRGGARGRLAPRRLGETHGVAGSARDCPSGARLRLEERRPESAPELAGALRGAQARVASDRARAARGRGRGAVRARLDRRPARRRADRTACARDARGHDARTRRGGRRGAARPRARDRSRRSRSTR